MIHNAKYKFFMLDRGYRDAIIDSFEIIKFILADRGYRFIHIDSFRCMKAFTLK